MSITAERLKKLVSYDPDTGEFIRIARVKGARIGRVAGHIKDNGYIHFSVDGKKYGAHRLAWLYMTGDIPSGDIDHIDGNRANNKFSNLRCVDRSTNLENSRRAKSHNRGSGLLGAYLIKRTGRYHSKITVRGRSVSLGCFDTAQQAHEAYMAAKESLHTGYVRI